MHLPTLSPIYRLCELLSVLSLDIADFRHRNIHTITLIQHLLHGVKRGGGHQESQGQAGTCEESTHRPEVMTRSSQCGNRGSGFIGGGVRLCRAGLATEQLWDVCSWPWHWVIVLLPCWELPGCHTREPLFPPPLYFDVCWGEQTGVNSYWVLSSCHESVADRQVYWVTSTIKRLLHIFICILYTYIWIIYTIRVISQSEDSRNQFWGYRSSLIFGTALGEGEPPGSPSMAVSHLASS